MASREVPVRIKVDGVEKYLAQIAAAKAVLADRERELLELKGSCSDKKCRLHYAHSGPCDTRLPGDVTPADPRFDAELRTAICEWLTQNGIDPTLVPDWERPDCSYRDGGGVPLGGHTITTRVRVRVSPDSKSVIVRPMSNRVEETTVTKPMKVAPPFAVQAWLDSTCPTCGR